MAFQLTLWLAFGLGVTQAASPGRTVLNFDFGWRHRLGNSHPTVCVDSHDGVNIGTGGSMSSDVRSSGECCGLCNADPECSCWDWNTGSHECWLKTDCTTSVPNSARVSGRVSMPVTPPEAGMAFDDAAWELVSAPHDMLIAQPYNQSADQKQAFIFRNVGWYRKHFKLPADWQGGSILWVYIEGSFHETTAWLNGKKLEYHKAGYTSWWIRIDQASGLQWGADATNVLALYVNASSGTGWWYEGGGLMRHNWLVRANPVHVVPDTAWAYTANLSVADKSATFHSQCTVANQQEHTASVQVRSTIVAPGGLAVGSTTSLAWQVPPQGHLEVATAVDLESVELWSIHSPKLYTVVLEVVGDGKVVDAVNFTSGARTVRFDSDEGLFLNEERVKVRGFCDHSNFGGVGGAVPDRVNLFRVQALRAVGANAWRMAHNPPVPGRLDMMDRLGMLAMDENRDYGGNKGQGGTTAETVSDELDDMKDMIMRDRSHPSVFVWSFCNEVGCNNESSAQAFRAISKVYDPTRAVTQNHLGSDLSSDYLDVQGFSHKQIDVFEKFHKAKPGKPMMATECCSCMSQRGVDQDMCPNPKDGGCVNGPPVSAGTFYNSNIGRCTSQQVVASDVPDYVTGTFIWSGFDYLGEARGWPQNTKCRGTVADVAGFPKETAYWIRSWWLSNISKKDAGRPPVDSPSTTLFILEQWHEVPGRTNRTINVYSDAPVVVLELNRARVGSINISKYGMATFEGVLFKPGNLTARAYAADGVTELASYTIHTPGKIAALELSLDAPSAATGTGSALLLDCQDTAMVRAQLVDSSGQVVPEAAGHNVTFKIVTGPGRVSGSHNGDPANLSPSLAPLTPTYYGLARGFVQTTVEASSPFETRQRMLQVDTEQSECQISTEPSPAAQQPIVVHASAAGFEATLEIPVSVDPADSPLHVALQSSQFTI